MYISKVEKVSRFEDFNELFPFIFMTYDRFLFLFLFSCEAIKSFYTLRPQKLINQFSANVCNRRKQSPEGINTQYVGISAIIND